MEADLDTDSTITFFDLPEGRKLNGELKETAVAFSVVGLKSWVSHCGRWLGL